MNNIQHYYRFNRHEIMTGEIECPQALDLRDIWWKNVAREFTDRGMHEFPIEFYEENPQAIHFFTEYGYKTIGQFLALNHTWYRVSISDDLILKQNKFQICVNPFPLTEEMVFKRSPCSTGIVLSENEMDVFINTIYGEDYYG